MTTEPWRYRYAEGVERRGLSECKVCSGEVDTSREDQYRPLRLRIEQGEVEV